MEDNSSESKSENWRDIVSILFIAYLTPVAAIPVWMISRWSQVTKWVVTAISILALVLLYYTSYGGYKFAKFQKNYSPVLEVQQALDLYGIQNGKYPSKLDELKPNYLKALPESNSMEYVPEEDGKSYELKAKVDNKNVVLGPVLKSQ